MSKSPQPAPSSGHRIQEIDALRGLAAIAVLFHHYIGYYDFQNHLSNPLDEACKFGCYGVHLFFVISGFVILMTLQRCRSVLDFVVSRFSRIFPAYWTAIVVTFVALILLRPDYRPSLIQLAMNFTMLEKFFGIGHIDKVYWTLNVELSFYFWMVVAFRFGGVPKIERIIPFVLSFQMLVALFNRLSGHMFSQGTKVVFQLEYAHLFCAGMIFFLVWKDHRLDRRRMLLLLWCLVNQAMVRFRDFDWIPDPAWGIVVVAFIFAIMFLVVRGKMTWLVHPTLLFLGSISYSLYLLHDEIGRALMDALRHAGYSRWYAFGAAVLAVFALATIVTCLIEKPAMREIRRRYKASRASPSPAKPVTAT